MKNKALWIFIALMVSVFGVGAQTTTRYTLNAPNYATVINHTNCDYLPGTYPCLDFTTAMSQTGSFTVASPLAANLSNVNMAGSLLSFSFADGITSYSSADPSVRIILFNVTTDGAGAITSSFISIDRWMNGTNGAHAIGDPFSRMIVGTGSSHKNFCSTITTSPAGAPDSCTSSVSDTNTSGASVGGAVTWTSQLIPPASIPTLSEWAMIIMASLMVFFAMSKMRRSI